MKRYSLPSVIKGAAMIKIIGGIYRSRIIFSPDERTIPSKNRTREGIANALNNYFPNATVLDLFAGSGALGIEAISRGADKCFFFDISDSAISCINRSLQSLKCPNGEAKRMDYLKGIQELKERNIKIDIVFIDPPYKEKDYYLLSTKALHEAGILKEKAILILEYEGEEIPFSQDFIEERRYSYGRSKAIMLRERK